jgi:hypothetical protein
VMDRPEWRHDLPRMARGLTSTQYRGAWSMTTENLLGTLALRSFVRRFESARASGVVEAFLQEAGRVVLSVAPGRAAVTGFLPWPDGRAALQLQHTGAGTAWAGVRALARVEPESVQDAGFRLARRVIPVMQAVPDRWSRGDVYRVALDIQVREGTAWVAVTDPIPAGSAILGSGLGRDARSYATNRADDWAPAYEERASTAYRAYFDYLPAGRVRVSYTVRLNAIGDFSLPPSRVEALYRPDRYGLLPNGEGMRVHPGAFDGEADAD